LKIGGHIAVSLASAGYPYVRKGTVLEFLLMPAHCDLIEAPPQDERNADAQRR